MIAAAAVAAALAGLQPAPFAGRCVAHVCDADTLAPVWDRLEAGRGHPEGRPVHILQVGDSHTAGDAVTGAWRTLLQARYGSGGRGVLPPARPFDGYLPRGLKVVAGPGWRIDALFGRDHREGGEALGVSGFSATSTGSAASMSLAADPAESFDELTVCALGRPGAGALTLAAGGRRATVLLDRPEREPACTVLDAGDLVTSAEVTAEGGPVTVTSWSTRRSRGGGVVLSNLGVVGAQAVHLARADEAVARTELAQYRPDLVVVAFGTNEAFAAHLDLVAYGADLAALLERLKRLAPSAALLVLGAPDSVTSRPDLRARTGPLAGRCDAQDGAPATGAALFTPATLETVRDIQRRAAREAGAAFWDWSQAVGGRCTAARWSRAAPPLMRGDGVHFTTAGAREVAERLDTDLREAIGSARAAGG